MRKTYLQPAFVLHTTDTETPIATSVNVYTSGDYTVQDGEEVLVKGQGNNSSGQIDWEDWGAAGN